MRLEILLQKRLLRSKGVGEGDYLTLRCRKSHKSLPHFVTYCTYPTTVNDTGEKTNSLLARFVQTMCVGRGRKDRGFIPPVANPKDHFHPPSKKKNLPLTRLMTPKVRIAPLSLLPWVISPPSPQSPNDVRRRKRENGSSCLRKQKSVS